MDINHAVYTRNYLSSTQSVLYAGKKLRRALGGDKATLNFAISGLERAARQQESGGNGYRAFMFSELETKVEADKEVSERMTEDVFASILIDIQTANVLMAAGQTIGETGKKAEAFSLDKAILDLESTTQAIERSLSRPLEERAESGRFGFAEMLSKPEVIKSVDLPDAIETFRRHSNEALTTLVNEAEGVVSIALSKIDTERALDALSALGGQMQGLNKKWHLIRQGIEKLESAINALINLLGSKAMVSIKDRIERIWAIWKEGKYLANSLVWAFGIEKTREFVSEMLRSSGGLKREALERASNDLVQLMISFKDNMSMAKRLVTALTSAGTLLFLIPMASANLALWMAAAYFVIIAAVVLIGMDYTDSGIILRRVRGVHEIASSVRVA